MTPNEIQLLDNRYAILFIRGERPVRYLKYNIMRHPNIKHTVDGGAEPYRYGEDSHNIASIHLDPKRLRAEESKTVVTCNSLLLTESEKIENLGGKST